MRALLTFVVTCLLVGASTTLVLVPGCGSKKPDLVIYDIKFSLIKSTDPLSDIMNDESRKSTMPSEPKLKQFFEKLAKNTQRSHEADPYRWAYWFTCYIKNRGDKDAFEIGVKATPPANTTKHDSQALLNATLNPQSPDYWYEFYLMGGEGDSLPVLQYLKSGEVKRVCAVFCWGRFRREPSPELVGKLKGTRLEIGSFKSEP